MLEQIETLEIVYFLSRQPPLATSNFLVSFNWDIGLTFNMFISNRYLLKEDLICPLYARTNPAFRNCEWKASNIVCRGNILNEEAMF